MRARLTGISILATIGLLATGTGQAKPTANGESAGSGGKAEPTGSGGKAKPTDSGGKAKPTDSGRKPKPTKGPGKPKPTKGPGRAKPTNGPGKAKPTNGPGKAKPTDQAGSKKPTGGGGGGAGDQVQERRGEVEPQGAKALPPVLGQKVLLSAPSGVVLLKPAHTRHFQPLAGGVRVQVGSVVDARRGAVQIVTARGSNGATQTATAAGGAFLVHQASGGRIRFVLRGDSFRRVCGLVARPVKARASLATAHASVVTAHVSRRSPVSRHRRHHRHHRGVIRSLWASDNHGLFSTQGLNSIATVRGTTWVTEDRCDGTLTIVLAGQVAVRDRRRHRVFVINAGQEHLVRNQR